MTGGWIKLHRSILEHPWLNDRLDWFGAWNHILLSTNYETGEVNLTEVYRTLSKHFTKNQWRAFVRKLAGDDMLTDFQTENFGRDIGYVQRARVAKWDEYQGSDSRRSPKRSADAARTQPETQRPPDHDDANGTRERSPKRSADAARTQPETLSYKNTSKQEDRRSEEGTSARDDFDTSEARFNRTATGDSNPAREHAARHILRAAIGEDFTTKHQGNLEAWGNRWTDEELRVISEASKPDHWTDPKDTGKPREWFLFDLLEQKRDIPNSVWIARLSSNLGRTAILRNGEEATPHGLSLDCRRYQAPGIEFPPSEVQRWVT